MKPEVLFYTRDPNFDGLLGEALSGTGAIVLIARTVADALQIANWWRPNETPQGIERNKLS